MKKVLIISTLFIFCSSGLLTYKYYSSINKAYSGSVNCSDFLYLEDAMVLFNNHNPGKDPYKLDADKDGVPCESLPMRHIGQGLLHQYIKANK